MPSNVYAGAQAKLLCYPVKYAWREDRIFCFRKRRFFAIEAEKTINLHRLTERNTLCVKVSCIFSPLLHTGWGTMPKLWDVESKKVNQRPGKSQSSKNRVCWIVSRPSYNFQENTKNVHQNGQVQIDNKDVIFHVFTKSGRSIGYIWPDFCITFKVEIFPLNSFA